MPAPVWRPPSATSTFASPRSSRRASCRRRWRPICCPRRRCDLIDRVVAPRADDWRAVVAGIRAVPDARLEDDVAALTADGPLRPVRERETGQ